MIEERSKQFSFHSFLGSEVLKPIYTNLANNVSHVMPFGLLYIITKFTVMQNNNELLICVTK